MTLWQTTQSHHSASVIINMWSVLFHLNSQILSPIRELFWGKCQIGSQFFHKCFSMHLFPGDSVVKNLLADAGDVGLISQSRKIPRRRKWQPTPVFLPGESNGQRSLVGYSPRGCKGSDMTDWAHTHVSLKRKALLKCGTTIITTET